MINLLFISNNPHSELLKVHFLQILKMRIEVVEDFDQGLKDVFEKRPAVVCIQDQIGGVSGESVARHIQLLLGKDASHFILLHDGNPKARIVPGLFNHLVDLSAPFETVCESLFKALHVVLGSHWDAIYTAPPEVEPLSEKDSGSGLPSAADQLIDDFLAESSIFNPKNMVPFPSQEGEPVVEPESVFEHDLPGGPPAEPEAAKGKPLEALVTPDPLVQPVKMDPVVAAKKPPASLMQPLLDPPVRIPAQKPPVVVVPEEPPAAVDETSVPVEELLLAFEENYKSRKRMIRLVVVVLLVLLAFGLAFILLKQRRSESESSPAVVKQHLPVRPEQAPVVQIPVSSAKSSTPVTQSTASKPEDFVPSFIPRSGHDAGFTSKKPGWSRYLSERRDYRLFHADGKLIALQVLVIGDGVITVSELKLALREITGKDQFTAGRQEHKGTLWQEHAIVSGHAELLIYRSRKNGPIKAFVIAPTP